MSNYNNQGGNNRQHKDKACYAEFTGTVRPLTMKEGDPIRFFQFKNGGGAIHFLVEVAKTLPADASGQERVKTERYKVDAYTNKDLTPEFLQSLVPGTKVNIACEPTYNFQKDQNGQPAKPELVFRAFAIRVREYAQQPAQQAPQQYPAYQPGYAAPAQPGYQQPYQQQYAPAQYPNQPYGQPGGQYVPQGGFAQPQQPQRPQAPYQNQGYPQQPAGQPVPPYFKPAPQPQVPGDMPDFDNYPDA